MKTYTENLGAGVALKLGLGGRMFYMQNADQGPIVTVEFLRGGSVAATVENVGKGFKALPAGGFDALRFKSGTACAITFIVSDGDVTFAFNQDQTIIGNDDTLAVPVRVPAGERLPVDISGGTITVTADNVGVNNTDVNPVPVQHQALATIVDHDPVAVGVATIALVADPTFKRLRIKNASDTQTIAIGGAAVTMANAAIILAPGDMWSEDDAAGASWYAVADAAGADVRVMGVKA